ncbi:hypothetical protein EJK15_00165 [Nonomuraea basaltis]|nr:hypothetical protein EJK15_00165 [Nonomuraea basaltis]
MNQPSRIVVVGASAAGLTAAETLRRANPLAAGAPACRHYMTRRPLGLRTIPMSEIQDHHTRRRSRTIGTNVLTDVRHCLAS